MGTGHSHLQTLVKEKKGLSSPAYMPAVTSKRWGVGQACHSVTMQQNMAVQQTRLLSVGYETPLLCMQ